MKTRSEQQEFAVQDEQGNRKRVIQTTTYEVGTGGPDGGDRFLGFSSALDDGTPVEAMLGNETFIDVRTGVHYRVLQRQ